MPLFTGVSHGTHENDISEQNRDVEIQLGGLVS